MSDTKECPYCAETIKAAAIKCRYCHSDLTAGLPGAGGEQVDLVSALPAWQEYQQLLAEEEYAVDLDDDLDLSVDGAGNVALELSEVRFVPAEANNGEILVGYRLGNRSMDVVDVSATCSFYTASGAHLGDGLGVTPGLRAWDTQDVELVWGPAQLPWLHLANEVRVQAQVTASQPDPEAYDRLAAWEATQKVPSVELRQWRGRKFFTQAATVAARCQDCGHRYRVKGDLMNALAHEQGGLSRVVRGFTWLETLSTSRLEQNRRIAAGNELERLEGQLATLVVEVSCPECFEANVLFEDTREP